MTIRTFSAALALAATGLAAPAPFTAGAAEAKQTIFRSLTRKGGCGAAHIRNASDIRAEARAICMRQSGLARVNALTGSNYDRVSCYSAGRGFKKTSTVKGKLRFNCR